MKYFISEETGSVYCFDEGGMFSEDTHKDPNTRALFYAPINEDGTFDDNQLDVVAEDLVADEETLHSGRKLSEVYADARKALGAREETNR